MISRISEPSTVKIQNGSKNVHGEICCFSPRFRSEVFVWDNFLGEYFWGGWGEMFQGFSVFVFFWGGSDMFFLRFFW